MLLPQIVAVGVAVEGGTQIHPNIRAASRNPYRQAGIAQRSSLSAKFCVGQRPQSQAVGTAFQLQTGTRKQANIHDPEVGRLKGNSLPLDPGVRCGESVNCEPCAASGYRLPKVEACGEQRRSI